MINLGRESKMRKTIILEIFILMLFLLFIPFSYANGGCIKLADDVFVQMSHAPHVPKVNEKTSFLFSFGNNEGLINQEIDGQLKLMKGEDIILAKDFQIKDGVLELKHEFNNPGLYEIFLEFNVNGKDYMPEDFVVEVIEKQGNKGYLTNVLFLLAGILIGILSSKLFKHRK